MALGAPAPGRLGMAAPRAATALAALAGGMNLAAATYGPMENLPLLAALALGNGLMIGVSMVVAYRGGAKGPALWPLLILTGSLVLVSALPSRHWQAARALNAHRADLEQFVQRVAAGDVGETLAAGPRRVRLDEPVRVPIRRREILAERSAGATWVCFPLYQVPYVSWEGGLLWSRAGGPAVHTLQPLDTSPQGAWYSYTR